MNMPRIGIVILNFNCYPDTSTCLRALAEVTYPNSQVFLVDNGSTDGSGQLLFDEFPSAVSIELTKNFGCPGGRNIGAERALAMGCDYVLFLDDDAIVTREFLEPLVTCLASDATIAGVSGKIFRGMRSQTDHKNVLWFAGSARAWHTWFRHLGMEREDIGQFDHPQEIPTPVGCLMLVRGDVIKKIGMFSDEYFGYWEEPDWAARAAKIGYRCYFEPRSIVYHNFESGRTGMETPFYNYLQFRNALIYNKKHNSLVKRIQFTFTLPLLIARRVLVDLYAKNTRGARAVLWGVLDYFHGYRGKQGLIERGIL